MEQVNFGWRKSSFSGNVGSGSCVELGQGPGGVLIRDTKNQGRGPVLQVGPTAWHCFAAALKQA